jgi:hypothetical protein
LRLQHPDDVLEHQIAGAMTLGVVGCLQTVDIDVDSDQSSVAQIRPVDLVLDVRESRSPAPRAGQGVDFVGLTLRRGLGAVLGGQDTVPSSQRSVTRGSIAVCAGIDAVLC